MSAQKSKGLHIALWIAQGLLAALFLMAGSFKSLQPIAELATKMPWVKETPAALVRFIGISEVLAAIGLILPSALRILPALTVYAAYGIIAIMIPAIYVHASHGEYGGIGVNVVIIAIAVFVAWGRSTKAVISAK